MKKAITGKRKKTDADYEEIARLEFLGGLYMNDEGPFIPSGNFRKCLIEGARRNKDGKQFEVGLFVLNDAKLIYEGPRDAKAMWESKEFMWTTVVGNQRASIMRTRPRFNDWQCQFEVDVDTSMIDANCLQNAIENAQKMGICDARNIGYGRFKATVSSA